MVSVESGVGWIPFILETLDYEMSENAPDELAEHEEDAVGVLPAATSSPRSGSRTTATSCPTSSRRSARTTSCSRPTSRTRRACTRSPLAVGRGQDGDAAGRRRRRRSTARTPVSSTASESRGEHRRGHHRTLDRRPRGRRHVGTRAGRSSTRRVACRPAEVAFASAAEVDDAVKVAVDAAASVGATSSLSRRDRAMFRLRELIDAPPRRPRRARHERARQGARRRRWARWRAASSASSSRAASRTCSRARTAREVSTGIDVHTVLAAGGRRRRHHAVQLPGDGAAVDAGQRVACGNAFVLKPSEKDPSASLLLAELVQQAGVPRRRASPSCRATPRRSTRCSTHPDVDAVSFVGSTPIARHVYETGTAHGKRVQALGGAKNHMVVLPDADVDAAADAAISAGYGSAGERCMAISVVVAVGAGRRPARRRDRRPHPRRRRRTRRRRRPR